MSPKIANSFRMINCSLERVLRYVLYSTAVLLFNFILQQLREILDYAL